MGEKPKDIDDYLNSVPEDKRNALQKLRDDIKSHVPEAEETIAYSMPAFRLNRKILVGFAAAKEHCSLYPWSSSAIDAHKEQLEGFSISAGTIRFTPGKPIPDNIVKSIIDFRISELKSKR